MTFTGRDAKCLDDKYFLHWMQIPHNDEEEQDMPPPPPRPKSATNGTGSHILQQPSATAPDDDDDDVFIPDADTIRCVVLSVTEFQQAKQMWSLKFASGLTNWENC